MVSVSTPAPGIDMFVVDHHMHSNGTCMGDIYELTNIQEIIELVPRFGSNIHDNVNYNTSLSVMHTL